MEVKGTKDQIVDKALELFNRKGIEYVGMRELAAEMGMRIGNITYYFPTKDDLVLQLTIAYSELNSATLAAFPDTSLESYLQKSEQLFQNANKYRCLPLSIVHTLTQNKLVARRYKKVSSVRQEGLIQAMKALKNSGYLKINDEELWVLVSAFSLINRFWPSEASLSSKHLSKKQIDHYLKLVALLFIPYATAAGKKDIDHFLSKRKISREP